MNTMVWRLLLFLLAGTALAAAPTVDTRGTTAWRALAKPMLFYLDLSGKVMRADVEGTNPTVIVSGLGVGADGIAVDVSAGHIYWTSMGKADVNDGTIMRADLDGANVMTIVPAGGAFTPKQLALDAQHRKLYWSDREGLRVMRANLDGSQIETLVITGGDADRKDQNKWCVGIALDVARGQVYWSQKGGDNAGQGRILRAGMNIPAGEQPANRSDIEVLFANLPEPIDLHLDLDKRFIYWTDRGDNTISRAPMDIETPFDPAKRKDRLTLVSGLHEAIGIALDRRGNRMFYTSLGGELGAADLDGGNARTLFTHQGRLTGIAFVDAVAVPAQAATQAKPYSPPRTPEGKPDLQGIWANNNATPLERPKVLAGRALLTADEVAALRRRQEEIFAGDGDAAFGDAIYEAVISDVQKYKPTTFDASTGNYNAFWLVERDFDNRTSLITDPADGRIPPQTEAAKERNKSAMAKRAGNEGPEARSLSERCITFGVPDLLAGYNSYYQIVQTPQTVLLHAEKIHDARIIPIGGGPHAPSNIRSWSGDSRGHWEGDTLVVDTVNLRSSFRGASEDLHLIERFTRVGPSTLHYEVTVDDPATWTRQWTLMIPLQRTEDRIYEYACHEGNSSLAGILAGARAEEERDQ